MRNNTLDRPPGHGRHVNFYMVVDNDLRGAGSGSQIDPETHLCGSGA
jgi:hypothetical protein